MASKRATLTLVSPEPSQLGREIYKAEKRLPKVLTLGQEEWRELHEGRNTHTDGQTLYDEDIKAFAESLKCLPQLHGINAVIDYGSGPGVALRCFQSKGFTECLGLEINESTGDPGDVIYGFDCTQDPRTFSSLAPEIQRKLTEFKDKPKVHYCYGGGLLPIPVIDGMMAWMKYLWNDGDILVLVWPPPAAHVDGYDDILTADAYTGEEAANKARETLGIDPVPCCAGRAREAHDQETYTMVFKAYDGREVVDHTQRKRRKRK